jgi:aminocarboxymuconate-semialdehyde decarboxylase
VSVVGVERVLFGTDWPHQVFDIKGAFVHTGTFAPTARDAMRSVNARRIFGI